MKRFFLFISLIVLILAACQEDDVCIESTTPRLHFFLKSIDGNDTIDLTEDSLIISVLNDTDQETNTLVYTNASSVFYPFALSNSTETRLRIRRDSTTNPVFDDLTLTYSIEEEFIDKACGFKVNYLNLEQTLINNDLQSVLLPTPNEIRDEQDTIFIFYSN